MSIAFLGDCVCTCTCTCIQEVARQHHVHDVHMVAAVRTLQVQPGVHCSCFVLPHLYVWFHIWPANWTSSSEWVNTCIRVCCTFLLCTHILDRHNNGSESKLHIVVPSVFGNGGGGVGEGGGRAMVCAWVARHKILQLFTDLLGLCKLR